MNVIFVPSCFVAVTVMSCLGRTLSVTGMSKVSVPSSPSDVASWPFWKFSGSTPMPTRFERWILSNDLEMTAFTPSRKVPFAAQSLDEPMP